LAEGNPKTNTRERPNGPEPGSVGAIVGQLKPEVTKRVKQLQTGFRGPLWQRNYHEHVLRDEQDLLVRRDYIAGNPASCREDEFYRPDDP
jgi:putative transposase